MPITGLTFLPNGDLVSIGYDNTCILSLLSKGMELPSWIDVTGRSLKRIKKAAEAALVSVDLMMEVAARRIHSMSVVALDQAAKLRKEGMRMSMGLSDSPEEEGWEEGEEWESNVEDEVPEHTVLTEQSEVEE
eukprot:CAMPEP_0184298684 /NCGR_PEP_ID=MMETSP1049-20130417/9445_1 /TAXON_ID=77928 /ORGANISM="Proteomonas sulcata, Strain CCMP704" /LENGTH=132 /DNA_ID=CAMNT_0026608885 /DNA_START=63 /DNA_END=458 /DNA_ORIENTATION=+